MAALSTKTCTPARVSSTAVLPVRGMRASVHRTPAFQGPSAVTRANTPDTRRSLVCKAADGGDPTGESSGQVFMQSVNSMFKEYDFLSTGMGALCVTGYFWSHGQPPVEALGITVVSTIVALVANELFFKNDSQRQ